MKPIYAILALLFLSAPALAQTTTFNNTVIVPADAYDESAWNGSNAVPTKDAVRDKIESLGSGGLISDDIDTADEFAAIMTEVSGSGSFLRATSPTITTPTIAKLANLTSDGFVKTSGGDGTLSVDTTSYQTLDSDLTSWASVTRASGFDTFAATSTSANLASLITNETGTGNSVFSASPTFSGQVTIGTFNGGVTGPLSIEVDGSGRGFVVAASATEYTQFISGGVAKGFIGAGSVEFIFRNGGDLGFQSAGATSDQWKFSSGHFLAATDNTYNIGANGATRPKDIFIAGNLNYGAAVELTIATGAVTITRSYQKIDTEADAASDDLDTINGGIAGDTLILRAENDARTVVIKDGTGNIQCEGDCTLDNTQDTISLIYDGSAWFETGRSNNGT